LPRPGDQFVIVTQVFGRGTSISSEGLESGHFFYAPAR
jgi:hypothetical protein